MGSDVKVSFPLNLLALSSVPVVVVCAAGP